MTDGSLRLAVLCLVVCASHAVGQNFVNVTAASGINNPAPTVFNGHGRGGAWSDLDNDGDMDLFVAGGNGRSISIWWNSVGTFTEQILLPAGGTPREDHQTVAADFDNDGDQDVYVCHGLFVPNRLYVNHGGGVFTEEAAVRGLDWAGDSYTASWGDYDRDGWLDLYVGDLFSNSPTAQAPDHKLFRNDGTGHFTDVTAAAGAAQPGNALAVMWFDQDHDGWPDILIGNDRGNYGAPPNALMRNHRDGTFSDVGPQIGAAPAIGCMGVTVADTENDGDWDIFYTNVPAGHVLLMWNDALGQFDASGNYFAVANSYGLNTGQTGWGCQFFDYDHDGHVDLFITHSDPPCRLHKGNGTGFGDVTVATGIAAQVPPDYGSCVVDYDDDGDLDIFMAGFYTPSQLIENLGPDDNWIKLKLEGTISNRDGLGARVIAHGVTHTQQRAVTSGEGFLCDGDRRVHFGLGSDTVIPVIEIRWPSGTVQFIENVAVNQTLPVKEPSFERVGSLAPGTSTAFRLDVPDDASLMNVAVLLLNLSPETVLTDGRRIRADLTDPVLLASLSAGNGFWGPAVATVPTNGSLIRLLTIPPVPMLSGYEVHMLGVSVDLGFVGGVKTIVGPQKFIVQ